MLGNHHYYQDGDRRSSSSPVKPSSFDSDPRFRSRTIGAGAGLGPLTLVDDQLSGDTTTTTTLITAGNGHRLGRGEGELGMKDEEETRAFLGSPHSPLNPIEPSSSSFEFLPPISSSTPPLTDLLLFNQQQQQEPLLLQQPNTTNNNHNNGPSHLTRSHPPYSNNLHRSPLPPTPSSPTAHSHPFSPFNLAPPPHHHHRTTNNNNYHQPPHPSAYHHQHNLIGHQQQDPLLHYSQQEQPFNPMLGPPPLISNIPFSFSTPHPPPQEEQDPYDHQPRYSDHARLADGFLAQYHPPPPLIHHPDLPTQSDSVISSTDEIKLQSDLDRSTVNILQAYDPPSSGARDLAELTHLKDQHHHFPSFEPSSSRTVKVWKRAKRRKKTALVKQGYKRLALIGLLGALLIGAAVAIVIVVRIHRARLANLAGGSEGDIISQSGLGTARNGTLEGIDPFDLSGLPIDGNEGLKGGGSINGYDSLIVFGASYCDNAHARPASLKSSLRPPPYYKGRWTNGYVWNEYLAQMIGLNGRPTTLVNYAYGSATVDNVMNEAAVPDLEDQVSAFLSDLGNQSAGAGPANGKSIVAIWVGINSVTKIWNGILKEEGKARSQSQVQESILRAQSQINMTVDKIFDEAEGLLKTSAFRAGAPDLLLLPIPPAQLLLSNVRVVKSNPGALRTLSTLSDLFNRRFSDRLNRLQSSELISTTGSRVFSLDVPTIWRRLIDEPGSYGLSIVDQPCLLNPNNKNGGGGGNGGQVKVCDEPKKYLFWDTLHPTTYVHQLFAVLLRDVIRS